MNRTLRSGSFEKNEQHRVKRGIRVTGSVAICCALIVIAAALCVRSASAREQKPDYSLGKPRLWTYQRVYPFLDGLFQDVASTQVSQLTLSPNAAGAATLDAVQNAFQLGVGYSPVAGAQNALAAQQNAVVSANATLQTQLLNQQAQLTQQIVAANQQVAQATTALNQLTTSSNPDPSQVTAATQALAAANNNLTALNNELSAIKVQLPSTLYTQQTYAAPSAPSVSSTGLPTGLAGLTAPPGSPQTLNFPSSKQMDNQFNLLWERLSRLVGTLAQADSLKDYTLTLASFDVNLLPNNRKKEVFGVHYCVTDATSGSTCDGSKAIVLDLFPSASAVNIVNNKYKDNRFGISFLASLFSVSANASYNREHLQMSQSLGQSAYITGFGAGTPEFGWAFGRNLGDDSVSPGIRTTWAIIAVPNTVTTVRMFATEAGWFKEGSDDWYQHADAKRFAPKSQLPADALCVICETKVQAVTDISYTPIEYDATSTTNSAATIQITLNAEIDPQLTISVDGRLIPRARDTFGRAVSTNGSAAGLLETNSFSPNGAASSWIPLSSKKLSISLNPAQVERRFPSIVLSSPLKTVGVAEFLKVGGATVKIGGDNFTCGIGCSATLPPLSYRKASYKQVLLFHRDTQATTACPDKCVGDIYISIPNDSVPGQVPASVSGVTPSLQVLTSQGPSLWGGNTVVTLETIDATNSLQRLSCTPLDSRLRCNFPDGIPEKKLDGATLQLHDPDHAGGTNPVSAWISVGSLLLDANERPIILAFSPPKWVNYCAEKTNINKPNGPDALLEPTCSATTAANPNTALTGLEMCFEVINMKDGENIGLMSSTSATPISNLVRLPSDQGCMEKSDTADYQGILLLPAKGYPAISDQMMLRFSAHPANPASLANLRSSAAPLVTTYDNQGYSTFFGQNLVMSHFRVGSDGSVINLICDTSGTSCVFDNTATTKLSDSLGKKSGPLNFVDDWGTAVPMQQNISNALQTIAFTYTAPPATPAPQDASGGKGAQGNTQVSLQMNLTGTTTSGTTPGAPSTTGTAPSGPGSTPTPSGGSTSPPPPPSAPSSAPNPSPASQMNQLALPNAPKQATVSQ